MTEQVCAGDIARSRRRLLLLAALFFGPMVAAWLFIRFGDGLIDVTVDSYGDLVQPVITLEEFQLPMNEDGLRNFQGVWTLLYPLKGECDSDCAQLLHDTRQVRTALAKEMNRLQRVVLWQTSAPDTELPLDDPKRHPGLRVFRGSAEQLEPLWRQLPENPEQALFLIDPMGNVMMRYSHDFEGKPLLKELNFLLKNSVLG